MTVFEALCAPAEYVDIRRAVGRISADFVVAFPPDIPVLVPGEVIGAESLDEIEIFRREGVTLQGIDSDRLRVIKC